MITITLEEYDNLRENYIGVCTTCGNQQDGVEPDAREIPCTNCGNNTVQGVEEFLFEDKVK